jgi:hypothetical protein
MDKSVAIFKAAFVNHSGFSGRHLPPTTELSQLKAMGRQVKMAVPTVQMPAMMTMAKRAQQTRRMERPGKTRRYWRRMEILVSVRLRL